MTVLAKNILEDAHHPSISRGTDEQRMRPVLATGIERFAEMRRVLDGARPQSGHEALSLLRRAFPDAPLAERVKAIDMLPRHA